MRSSLLAALLLSLLLLVPASAQAHGPGGGSIAVQGTFLLTNAGTQDDNFHAFLSEMGLPAHAGDTLLYAWSANNGSGPALYFEIHDHSPPAGFRRHYSTSNLSEIGEWRVPGGEDYMVFYQNLGTEPIFLTYSFSLLAGAPDYLPTILIVAAIGGFFAVLWFIWRGRGEAYEEETEEGGRV